MTTLNVTSMQAPLEPSSQGKGSKPSELPLEYPKKIDIVMNLKEAGNMVLKVPFDLLTTAIKVI